MFSTDIAFKAFLTVQVKKYIYLFSTMSTFQARDIPFLQGMTFHTQSMTRNNIKRDIGRHILNGFNFNKKQRETSKATNPTIF